MKNSQKPTHAGGIVFRETNGLEEYLLVSAKNFPFLWVLPKGHIEKGESEVKAAIREVKEESGMKVQVIDKIGNAEKIRWNFKKQVVAFYLMRLEGMYGENSENRQIKWLPLDKAIKKLYSRSQRKVLNRLKS